MVPYHGRMIKSIMDKCSRKSMMEQFKEYAPRFMCVGRKPHIFGNERHTICCDPMSILWRSHIVEGKYRLQ